MDNLKVTSAATDSAGRPILNLSICGYEVEATFAAEENAALLPRLKLLLFDTYFQNYYDAKPT